MSEVHSFKRLLLTKDHNCFPTALASCITDIAVEDLPRYFNCNFEVPGFMRLLEDWLKKRGYKLCSSFEENGLEYPVGVPVVALGRLANNQGHCCIYVDGVLAHDVAPCGFAGSFEVDCYLWFERLDCKKKVYRSIPPDKKTLQMRHSTFKT